MMKKVKTVCLALVVTSMAFVASFSFSAEKSGGPALEFDQFGLPHDTRPETGGIGVLGDTIHDSDMVGYTFKPYTTSSGSQIDIYGDYQEFKVYDQKQDLVDIYASVKDQTYLQGLKGAIYGPNGTHKVHLTGSRVAVFAQRNDGQMQIVGFFPIDIVKKGGEKAAQALGVKLAKAQWDETLTPKDIYLLAPIL